jgi:hypothetical protein
MTGALRRGATTAAGAAEVVMTDGESMSGDALAVLAGRQHSQRAVGGTVAAGSARARRSHEL